MLAASAENCLAPQCVVARVRARRGVRHILAATIAGLQLLCGSAPGRAVAQPALSTFDEVCVIRNREASAGIATILLGVPAAADARVDDALARLRRARTYCDRGWVDFARVELDAVRKAFPVTDRQVQLLFEAGRPRAALAAPQRSVRP